MAPLAGDLRVLNTVGSRIWALIDGTRSIDDIARTISQEFDVDVPTARADILKFVQELRDGGVLLGD
jgi:coenzyme PQQ synthesis protein D (PqqD)